MANKRKRHDGSDGRDCYTVSILDEKLVRADRRLQELCDRKMQLEDEVANILTTLLCIHQKAHELECRMEKMMSHQSTSATQQKMKEELDNIKKDKEFMDCEIKYYRKRVADKIKKLERCRATYYN